ncbi:putative membrane protein YqiK [Sphingomonas insulae]|uniref:Uncharacterized protein n=1 Tax=Sphingomonas insulae TaxID=424800 RepID=A0ABN1HWM8_9SPHN|nr:hypothetical protein [Sphingomonas insulae]NIJ30011.1 putative membrane protein YqiK [Sphingomonas insulae]
MIRLCLLGAALIVTVPVVAQAQSARPVAQPNRPLPHDPGQDSSNPRSNAIAAETAPDVAAANREIAAQARLQGGAVAAVNSANEARYAADVARYRTAMRKRRHIIAADAALQADRERAYAMAMADWRAQVDACSRGRTRACKRPTPNPQDYM